MDSLPISYDSQPDFNPYLEDVRRRRSDTMPDNLRNRYDKLVTEHLSPAHKLAAGIRALPSENEAFASTQAAWRFFANENVTLPQVFEPVLSHVKQQINHTCQEYVLVPCDWCNLHYKKHHSKRDRVALANKQDLGYETFNGLAVSDNDGQAIGPLWMELRDATGVHSTHHHFVRQPLSVLDEVIGNMQFTAALQLAVTPVFIVDSECDSIGHLRQWSAEGMKFLVRGKESNTAYHEGKKRKLSEIGELLKQSDKFEFARKVQFEGCEAQQWVAETEIVIRRPARPERMGEVRKNIPGPALTLRLIVSELRDEKEQVLARWYLQTNVDTQVTAATIVLWYYWRWQIENYHKLLKSAGQQLESWRQETGAAIARRIAVASMACVLVLRIQSDPSKQGEQARKLLTRLSGRQMSRKRPATAPALLAGLWVLLATLDVLQTHSLEELRDYADYSKRILLATTSR